MTAGADQTFRDVVREAIGRRDAIIRWRIQAGSVEAAIAELSRALGVEPEELAGQYRGRVFYRLVYPGIGMARDRRGAGARQQERCEQAQRFTALIALTGSNRLELYLEIFCTDEGNPRKSIVTKAIKDARTGRASERGAARVCDDSRAAQRRRSAATAAARCSLSPTPC